MNYVKTLVLNKTNLSSAIKFTILVSIATIVPLFHTQFITGPIVNATLFVAAAILSPGSAILVGLIPSIIALSSGLLPPVLAPMVPFIMLSNTILILVFAPLKKANYWLSITVSSIAKFLFLYGTSSLVINLLMKKEAASQVSIMLSWPQLVTALIGGIIAYGFLKLIKKA